jgi:cation diffusion facilitator family transporter
MASTTSSAAQDVRNAGWVGLVANLALAAFKLAAGTIGHSHAVVADAVHSLSDVFTDLAVILGVRYWSKPADERHPHGHHRIETLVAIVIGLFLATVALGLAWEAITQRHLRPEGAPTTIALVAALVSILVKELLYRWTLLVGRRVDSLALIANAWHHRSDALSSVPAALAVGVSVVAPQWALVDRIGAVVVCVFILYAGWRIVAPAVAQLLDTAAPPEERERLEAIALSVDGVRGAHALRTRYLGPRLSVDLHVVVAADLSVEQGYAIGEAVRRALLERGERVADVLVKVEPDDGTRSGEQKSIS